MRPRIPASFRLPRDWTRTARSGILQAMALASYAIQSTSARRGAKRDSWKDHEIARLKQELLTAREVQELVGERMARIAPHRRPHDAPQERLRILELKAWQGWSLERTARLFHVTEATITSWLARLDEHGPDALVRTPEPVNKFPLRVGYLVRRFQALCPKLGRRKLAAMLARAGLHLGATTVARLLKEFPTPPEKPADNKASRPRVIASRRPHDVWHVDLTVAPTRGGFWTTWFPGALPQCWPFGWWVAVVVDRYSRRALAVERFATQPTSSDVQDLLRRTMRRERARPKTIICDRGRQFDCGGFRSWCKRRRIELRYGAVGRHGSIALVERFIRTLKEHLRRLPIVSTEEREFAHELRLFRDWYNEHRPHEALSGRTPNEVYCRRFPAQRRPRYEPRSRWPRGLPCAGPWALVRGRPGVRLELQVEFYAGQRDLPIIALRRVA